jgi:hypothetical protein
MRECSCGRRRKLSRLEVIGIVVVAGVVVAILLAPHGMLAASLGGGLTGAGLKMVAAALGVGTAQS